MSDVTSNVANARKLLVAAQQALWEITELQSELQEAGVPVPAELASFVALSGDVDDMHATLLECETAIVEHGVSFIEDGGTPTPEPDFIDENHPADVPVVLLAA